MKIFLILLAFNGLAGCNNLAEPPKTINVELPVSDKIDKNDSTYLRIAVHEKNYELSLLDKYLKTENPDSIDQFITTNRTIVNEQKIALQRVDSSHDRFAKVIAVLKKHKIFKYRIETTGE